MISSEAECETVLERVCEAAVEDGAAPACREVPRQVCRSLPAQRQQCKYTVGQSLQLEEYIAGRQKTLFDQEDEDGEQVAWDYCEAGCPVTAECPPGWVQLPSGCYQTRLEVEAGVDR